MLEKPIQVILHETQDQLNKVINDLELLKEENTLLKKEIVRLQWMLKDQD